jgi:hypothetical protein
MAESRPNFDRIKSEWRKKMSRVPGAVRGIAAMLRHGVDRRDRKDEVKQALKAVVRKDYDFCWMKEGQRDKALWKRAKDGVPVFRWMDEWEDEGDSRNRKEEEPMGWTPPMEVDGLTAYQRGVLEGWIKSYRNK